MLTNLLELSPHSLTEVEAHGLMSPTNLADGHAYHDLCDEFRPIIANLPQLWRESVSTRIPDLENQYMNSFATLIRSSSLTNYPHFNICPTASNSIDIVGAWLRSRAIKVGLLEPTFDNLALLLRRREVPLFSITENNLHALDALASQVHEQKLGALFLVNPNNPTGHYFDKTILRNLARWCFEHNIVLILDRTFRLYINDLIDDYEILINSGATFIFIEDTGKTWATLDMKASALAYSQDIASEIKTIYQEVYLSVSAFSLTVLRDFFNATARAGLPKTLWDLVDSRRQKLRHVLQGSPFATRSA